MYSPYDMYRGDDGDEMAKYAFYMQLFQQMRMRRLNFETQWEESSALAWPEYMSSFYFGRDIAPGQKRTQYQVDSSVSIASHRFGAIADYMLTPSNMLWSTIKAGGAYGKELMRHKEVAQYFARLTHVLWYERYRAEANFIGQNQQNMQGLGVFGNMAMFVDELDDYLDPTDRGMRYLSLPVGEVYVEQDHQRRVVGFVRHFRLTAQQHKNRWPQPVNVIDTALSVNSQQLFDVLHFVRPRTDFNPFTPLAKNGKKYLSLYLSVQGHAILQEGGYRTLPLAYGRYMQAPDEDYGRGPMQIVLATAKTKNAGERVYLKQAHRAGDPAYLVPNSGLIDLQTHSGAIVAGGMSADGKPLVGVMPAGEIQITDEMLEKQGNLINDAFLVSLFKLILDNPEGQPSARQVVEYINERGILLFPTIGRQSTEYCSYIIDRELDILSRLRKLPPVPPILREAGTDYQIEYCSPIARAMQSQEIAGYVRTMEFAGEAVKVTGDPSLMDIFALDRAIPAMGERSYAPYDWFAYPEELKQKQQQRAKDAERDRQVKELPGRAAIIKAQAISDKAQAGQNTGGTLSGTPAGGMPMMPGQQEPGGSPFGQPGGQPGPQGQGP